MRVVLDSAVRLRPWINVTMVDRWGGMGDVLNHDAA